MVNWRVKVSRIALSSPTSIDADVWDVQGNGVIVVVIAKHGDGKQVQLYTHVRLSVEKK